MDVDKAEKIANALKPLREAPFAVFVLVAVTAGMTFTVTRFFTAERIEVLNSRIEGLKEQQATKTPAQVAQSEQPLATREQLATPTIRNLKFRITDVLNEWDDTIRNRTFEDCTVLGPAILLLRQNLTFDSNIFGGTLDELVWDIRPGRRSIGGAIALENVTFRRCYFKGIAFTGFGDTMQRFRAAFPKEE